MTTTSPSGLEPIPHPPGRLLLGNLFDLDGTKPVQSLMALARQHGSIFELELPNRRQVIVSSAKLVNELCDEKRFDKLVWAPLRNVRAFAGDGLFTAWTQEPNWHKAHNILLPNFSPRAMRDYMPQMLDIAKQLIEKWTRLNPGEAIDVPGDMTRLTLDTIGLCGFNYRFNSFYRDEPHPFIVAMIRALGEALDQLHRLPVQERLMVLTHRQFQEDISTMNALVDRIIRERRESGIQPPHPDLLSHMLTGVDKQSGEQLDDLNIRYQIITFLIAGHETTSGLLSFAIYFLLQHPEVLARAYAEVDRVLGADLHVMPTDAQVRQLGYIDQILKETLRLWPTAPAFALSPYEPTVLGGKYRVDKRQELVVLVPMLHRDRSVWGSDAEAFNPDHFSPEREQALPPNAYKPFGNGQRACIGRQFALQEATLVLGMLLQRFEFIDHTGYKLNVKETLTLKPENFFIQVQPRTQRTLVAVAPPPATTTPVAALEEAPSVLVTGHDTPLLVLYGSNLGTAEDLARQIAADGTDRGFATTIASLDDYVRKLPSSGAVAIVSASYNGTPPDNGIQFCNWLQSRDLTPNALEGVRYTVFGCGNRDWTTTYQAIPKLIDRELEAHGAQRIHPRGEGDARDDFDGQFRAWYGPLWSDVANALHIAAGGPPQSVHGHRYEVDVVAEEITTPLAATYGAQPLTIRENRELQRTDGAQPSERSTRHIVVTLPEGMSYHTGDYLGVLPRNHTDLIQRVAVRFGLQQDTRIRIRSNTTMKTHLPLDLAIEIRQVLADYVELQDVATRAQIQVLAEYTECPPEKAQLLALASDDPTNVARYRDTILNRRISVLDLLEAFPACALPFNLYLEMLAPLRPRYYSISSSSLVDAHTCSITVAVVNGMARSGRGEYHGVCSSYLARQPAGETLFGFVRDPNTPFRLPADPMTPLIMIGPGTGLAPFRGFLQERAVLQAQGQSLGPALLFFGCRRPEQDFIYQDELQAWVEQGMMNLFVAFSRVEGQPKTYVQDKLKEQQDEVWQLIQNGGCIYVCGDATYMAPDVRRTFAAIYRDKTGASESEAEAWLTELTNAHRYVADVWSTT